MDKMGVFLAMCYLQESAKVRDRPSWRRSRAGLRKSLVHTTTQRVSEPTLRYIHTCTHMVPYFLIHVYIHKSIGRKQALAGIHDIAMK